MIFVQNKVSLLAGATVALIILADIATGQGPTALNTLLGSGPQSEYRQPLPLHQPVGYLGPPGLPPLPPPPPHGPPTRLVGNEYVSAKKLEKEYESKREEVEKERVKYEKELEKDREKYEKDRAKFETELEKDRAQFAKDYQKGYDKAYGKEEASSGVWGTLQNAWGKLRTIAI